MSNAEHILDAAETRMRCEGYNAVSFRDIASDVGIKSASLHYYFPKKADLGRALVSRYAENFHAALKQSTEELSDPKHIIEVFIGLHRQAIEQQGLICLCAVFGAEAKGLPDPVNAEVTAFFEKNIRWLTEIYEQANVPDPNVKAKAAIALLEGALMVVNVTGDMSVFEAAAKSVALPD